MLRRLKSVFQEEIFCIFSPLRSFESFRYPRAFSKKIQTFEPDFRPLRMFLTKFLENKNYGQLLRKLIKSSIKVFTCLLKNEQLST